MPTVSSHDILGPMAWGANTNTRQAPCAVNSVDGGMNSLLSESSFRSSCTHLIANDHAYATGGTSRFVSDNGYYGFYPAVKDATSSDCSMDTSENNLPLGEHPSSCVGTFGGANVSNTDPMAWNATRKRNFQPDYEMERAVKRSKHGSYFDSEEEASIPAMAQSSGMLTSTPTVDDQSHSPAQMYDLPMHQLPGSTAHLMDAMTPRPRYGSDGVISKESACGGQMQLKILEEFELAALENLLRHTHGCEYYNYERSDF